MGVGSTRWRADATRRSLHGQIRSVTAWKLRRQSGRSRIVVRSNPRGSSESQNVVRDRRWNVQEFTVCRLSSNLGSESALTIRDYIRRRKAHIQIVVLIFWLPGVLMLSAGGRGVPFTSINYAGIAALLTSGLIYMTYIGAIRCPNCKKFIGLSTVSPLRQKPKVDRCVHCGFSFDELM